MWTKFFLKEFLHRNGSFKCLPLRPKSAVLCIPLKISPLLGFSSTAFPQSLSTESVGKEHESGFPNYYRNYVLSQPQYKSYTLDSDNLNFEAEGRSKFVELLKDLINHPEDEEFLQKLKNTLAEEVKSLVFEDICKTFYLTFQYRISNGQSLLMDDIVYMLLKELNCRQLSRSDILKALFVLQETWGAKKQLYFQSKMILRYCERIKQLSPEEALILFYCLIKFSEDTLKRIKFLVNHYISNNISSFNTVELGIIARGLLRSSMKCQKVLRQALMSPAVELNDCFEELPLHHIFKLLSKNLMYKSEGQRLLEFQERFIPYVSKHDIDVLVHLVFVGRKIGCLNVGLWEKIANLVKENINNTSLKTIQGMVQMMTEFDVQDEELVKLAIERFENTIDLDGDIRSLILFLNNLVHLGLYPEKLIKVACGEKCASYLKSDECSGPVKRTFYETLSLLEIDKPEINFNLISEKERTEFLRLIKFTTYYPEIVVKPLCVVLNEMYRTLKSIYGDGENIVHPQWRPFERAGFVMRFDRNLNATTIPVPSKPSFYPPKALKDDHIWVYIYVMTDFNSFFGTNKLKPCVQTYLRHLKELGYNIITVNAYPFKQCKEQETRTEFLHNLINNDLLNISQQNTKLKVT